MKFAARALARGDSRRRVARERRGDVGSGSHESGSSENGEDFELHIVFFVCEEVWITDWF